MIIKVGVTGGIGSGKSLVCSIFKFFGVPIYNADDRAKLLMVENAELRSSIVNQFGKACYLPSGELNREYLSSIVFHDNEKLKMLNALVHPVVQKDVSRWFSEQNSPYAIEEAALIFESGAYIYLDKVINVSAPINIRLKRVHHRDGSSYREIRSRMDKQLSDREKSRMADHVILNNGRNSLISQVRNIHNKLMKLSVQSKR